MEDTDRVSTNWCNIRDAANHLGMSVAFLRKQVRLRRIPFVRIGTKALRFRKADLDAWISQDLGRTER